MNPLSLIKKYYDPDSLAYSRLVGHSAQVARLAEEVAGRLAPQQNIDLKFVTEASWLHDIGIFMTNAPEIGCVGDAPYLAHGVLGAKLLVEEGLPRHAGVCERHVGVGISVTDIREQQLPLPEREMTPQTIEEEIVAYADLFFSKNRDLGQGARPADKVRDKLARFGAHKVAIFDAWHKKFGGS